MRQGLLRAAPTWAHAQGRLRFQCEDSFVENWMALSKLFGAVKKSFLEAIPLSAPEIPCQTIAHS